MQPHFFLRELREARDDDEVADAGAARRRAVDRNHPGPTLTANRVGDETLAIVDVPDVDLFVLRDVGGFEQVLVDGARAFVMQLAMRDDGAVDLGLE